MSVVLRKLQGCSLRFRILMEVESAHRRHIRGAATRGRPACFTRTTVDGDAPRPHRGIWLSRYSRRDRWSRHHVNILFHRGRHRHGACLLRVEVYANIVESYTCAISCACMAHGDPKECDWAIVMMSLTGKTSTVDVLNTMVGYKELLFPPHEHRSAIEGILHGQMRLLELVLHMPESGEPRPMNHILLFRRAPVARQEPIPTANYLSVKVGRELWPVVCEAPDPEVPAQVRRGEIDILH